MIRNCDAQGNPLPPLRQWWDAWWLLGEMTAFAFIAILMLLFDLYDEDREHALYGFQERMLMATGSVPFYLKHIHMCEKVIRDKR